MRFYRFPLLAAVALLASCTVYAPMQPTVSTITQAGQLELTGSAQLSGRAEGTAVYSPLAHVLLAGGGTYAPTLGAPPTLPPGNGRPGPAPIGCWAPTGS